MLLLGKIIDWGYWVTPAWHMSRVTNATELCQYHNEPSLEGVGVSKQAISSYDLSVGSTR